MGGRWGIGSGTKALAARRARGLPDSGPMRLENYTMSLRCAGRVDSASALAHNGKDSGFRLPGLGFHARAHGPRSRIPNTETRTPNPVYERCYRSSNQVRSGHRAGGPRPVADQV